MIFLVLEVSLKKFLMDSEDVARDAGGCGVKKAWREKRGTQCYLIRLYTLSGFKYTPQRALLSHFSVISLLQSNNQIVFSCIFLHTLWCIIQGMLVYYSRYARWLTKALQTYSLTHFFWSCPAVWRHTQALFLFIQNMQNGA